MACNLVCFAVKHMFCSILCTLLLYTEVFTLNTDTTSNVNINPPKPLVMKLSEQPECAADVQKLCGKMPALNNFAVIDCLQNDKRRDDEVSEACQHLVWNYKRNLTTDARFDSAVSDVCASTLKQITECTAESSQRGQVIPCLIENIENITDVNCRAFLRRMKTIVFSDYRLIYKFVDRCDKDIQKMRCGRTPEQDQSMPHNQGRTLRCLLEKFDDLAVPCKQELLRVAELQADDYHADRQLYYACRDDRETLCPHVKAGEGRVYKCLYRHKFVREMSENCRSLLIIRQKLEQADYKVNIRLAKSCQKDIAERHCLKQMSEVAGFKNAQMSAILLCLEGAVKDENAILEPDCLSELHEVRRSLMEDYQINPVLVTECSQEIVAHCGGKLRREGRTIHCLMDLAREKPKDDKNSKITPRCVRALEDILTEVDVAESYDIDPVLREQCDSVVQSLCSNVAPGDSRVMQCLMNSLEKPQMTIECKEGLMELYYFISRDFRLDPRLYKFCRHDAANLCHAPDNWHRHDNHDVRATTPGLGYMVLSCLFKRISHVSDEDLAPSNTGKVSRQCAFEVRRVMHERARTVDLDPQIENNCVQDLGKFCSDKTAKSEEMDCLEDNLSKLTEACRKAVNEYVEEVDEDPELNEIFARACAPFWEKHCQHALSKSDDDDDDDDNDHDKSDEEVADNLMTCLIQYKHHPMMDEKCRVGIEHHQLTTLQDYHFSHPFKQSCQRDVLKLCPKESAAKSIIVQCLSEHVRNDTLIESTHRVSKACRKQLKFELLQRNENVHLDLDLKAVCSDDMKKFCDNVSPGNAAVTECLRKHQKLLNDNCHALIFKREQEEANDPNIDFLLVSKCKSMIKKYCVEEMSSSAAIFTCLKRNKDEDRFDRSCLKTIILREELRAQDVRLNPELQKHCSKDIAQLCDAEMKQMTDKEMEGKVLLCLRKNFVKKKLSSSCEEHVQDLIRESAKDIAQDIALTQECAAEIKKHCSVYSEPDNEGERDNGKVEDCLKEHVAKKEITLEGNRKCFMQISRVLEEGQFDVQSDTALYRACANELQDHCGDIPSGEGRKISCLVSVFKEKKQNLANECRKLLEQRINMWTFIVPAQPLESLAEYAQMVSNSPSKNYLLAYLFCFICVIFVGGLFCGRVTKRVRREMKNR